MTVGAKTMQASVRTAKRHDNHTYRLYAETTRRLRPRFVADAQPHRHERGIQRAIGQQPPKQVWDLQRRHIGIRQWAGAQQRGDAGIADKTQHPGHEGRRTRP